MTEPILDTVVHMCYCGCSVFKILATFDDFEIATYSTDMYCADCGTKYKTPTELDRPNE